jgi:tripartite-type tricarboxylate transporter receptor subunit TctC
MITGFKRRTFHALATATMLVAACASNLAQAQSWPDKPIRLVVPAPAGSGLDVVARMLSEQLRPALGQQMIVDNKPGAGGIIGASEVLKSPRDGSTFMIMINGFASEIPHVVKMPFDPLTSFRPLVQLANYGLVLATNPQVPANDLAGFIAYAKANKGKISFASYSAGTVSHTLGLELNNLAGLDMLHVAYKGSPPALVDLMGGQVQAMFDASSNVMPHAKAGKLKVLAATTPQRLPTFPDVPTFAELGYKDLTEVAWAGLWSAADVPAPVQQRMRDATLKALQDPKMREQFTTMGWTSGAGVTPDEMLASLKAASSKQAATLKAIGFNPQ